MRAVKSVSYALSNLSFAKVLKSTRSLNTQFWNVSCWSDHFNEIGWSQRERTRQICTQCEKDECSEGRKGRRSHSWKLALYVPVCAGACACVFTRVHWNHAVSVCGSEGNLTRGLGPAVRKVMFLDRHAQKGKYRCFDVFEALINVISLFCVLKYKNRVNTCCQPACSKQ